MSVTKPGFKRVPCRLKKDQDGLSIVSQVNEALRKHGHADLIAEYQKRVFFSSYENLIKVSLEYVDEEGDSYG